MSLVADLSNRSSLSILTVPNSYLAVNDHLSLAAFVDVLRYHVLLKFLSWSDLRTLPLLACSSPHPFKPPIAPQHSTGNAAQRRQWTSKKQRNLFTYKHTIQWVL
ncbi:Fasciclin-like arabinogalactan protein 4 [Glycine soja]